MSRFRAMPLTEKLHACPMQKGKWGESPQPQLLCTLCTSMLCGDIPREAAEVLEMCSSSCRNKLSRIFYLWNITGNYWIMFMWKEKILICKIYKKLDFSSFFSLWFHSFTPTPRVERCPSSGDLTKITGEQPEGHQLSSSYVIPWVFLSWWLQTQFCAGLSYHLGVIYLRLTLE